MTTSQTPRQNLIRDIARWKLEYEHGGGAEMPDEDLEAYIASLSARSTEDLREFWCGTVGEWVLSRGDVTVEGETDAWLDQQLETVMAGGTPAYGFTVDVSIPPESEL